MVSGYRTAKIHYFYGPKTCLYPVTLWPILLPALAVLLSFTWLVCYRRQINRRYSLLLAFSGAFLLSVTLFELLPEAYSSGNPEQTGLWIALGILLQIFLESLSKGAEHGHVHHGNGTTFPWLLFASLSLHALTEGIPLQHTPDFMWGIVVHKIPVSLIIGGFLLQSGRSMGAIWGFMVFFALMTPAGAWIGSRPALEAAYAYLLPLVIGVVLHVSTIILFESSEGHAFNLRKIGAIVLGMALGFLL